jgi:lactate permease
MVAVHNVVAASATVGLVGREGELIRRTSIPMLVYSLAAGAIAFVGLNGLGMNAGTVILTALIVGLGVVIVMVRRSPGKPLTSGDDEPERSVSA